MSVATTRTCSTSNSRITPRIRHRSSGTNGHASHEACPLCARVLLSTHLSVGLLTAFSRVLQAKKECFHPVDKFCTCQDRKPNNSFKGPSTSAKDVDNMVSEVLLAIQALYAKKQAAPSEAPLPNPQGNILHVAACLRKLRVFFKKRDFARPQIFLVWDSTLGYPGEGPPLTFASINLRGEGISRQRWSSALSSFRAMNLYFVAIQ
eukprot:2121808-Pleurochrysis_carterae.AAC.2